MKQFPFEVAAFDLDGTLLDTAPDLAAAVNHMLGKLGRAVLSQEEVTKMIGGGMRLLMERALAVTGTISEKLVANALPVFLEYYESHLADQTRPYRGAEEALAELKGCGVKLAVCTNKPERLALQLLKAFNWSYYFSAVVGGDSLCTRKPDPSILFEAIQRSGGGRGILVGDSITDVETARAAKVPCVIMTFGYRDRRAEQLGATRLVASYDQLVSTLLDL